MFEQLGTFDPVFPDVPEDTTTVPPRTLPLKRRKTLRECCVFIFANLIIMPIVGLIYASVIAEGLRRLMPIFQLRIYKLPVPGLGIARDYDGWDRLDLAIVMSLLLFAVVTWLWMKVFIELQGFGTIADTRHTHPIVFFLLAGIATVIICGDALIFYVGLSAQSASGWTETPAYVAPAATTLYSCGLAVLGWWHADFKTSSLV
ncbi:hypothetical protein [Crateriforma conspicua]|uniref:hypothetical protein n=1 Tax=Crateriforma conspicua TaxID=2527996 RepID=UPI001189426F|nr:hypothetical protein [Crateriforma conspicua]QDV61989.1 hypothetical protein Mal65_11170 [Crateriforma conspicua]